MVTCGIGAGGAAINHLVMDTTLVMGAVMMLYAEIAGCVSFDMVLNADSIQKLKDTTLFSQHITGATTIFLNTELLRITFTCAL